MTEKFFTDCLNIATLIKKTSGVNMLISKITLVTFISLLTISSTSLGQSVAQPGKMCAYDIAIPKLNCSNPDAGADVRFSLYEFQDCKNGVITKLSKTYDAYVFGEPEDKAYEPTKVEVVFSGVRTHMDDRVDFLTIELPRTVKVSTAYGIYELSITNTLVPSYEGAETVGDMSFGGSFKQLTLKGDHVTEGRIHCSISR